MANIRKREAQISCFFKKLTQFAEDKPAIDCKSTKRICSHE